MATSGMSSLWMLLLALICAAGVTPSDLLTNPLSAIDVTGCGSTKGCMRSPRLCKPQDCAHLITWREDKAKGTVDFEMSTKSGMPRPWIAVGFSENLQMPNTAVVDCILTPSGDITVQASYNPGYYNLVLNNKDLGLISSKSAGSWVDGVLTCKFTKLIKVSQNETESSKVADLNKSYYLFLGIGPVDDQGHKKIHLDIPVASPYKIPMSKNMDVNIGQHMFIISHAVLMIISWMFLSSLGIVCSRHFKHVWNTYVCGEKLWFQIHRSLMFIVLLLTVVALVVIVIAVDWVPIKSQKLHPILGLIVASLMVFNFLLGLCRPHPETSARPVFNWVHCLVGNGAHFVAVAAMFFGVQALAIKIPMFPVWPQWVVAAFGGWRLLIEVIMTAQKYHTKEDLQVAYMEMSGGSEGMHLENPVFRFKTVMVLIYLCGVTGLTASLLYSIFKAMPAL